MPQINTWKAFKLAAGGLAIAGLAYVGFNFFSGVVYDYEKQRGDHITGNDTIDFSIFTGLRLFDEGSDGVAYVFKKIGEYGAWRRGEEHIDWDKHIMYCVPPAVSMDGWDNPEPGSPMEAFKAKAIQQIKNVAFGRTRPGSMYREGKPYRNRNIIIYIDELTYKEYLQGISIENHISVESHMGPGTNASCGQQKNHMGGGYQSYAVSVGKNPEVIPVPK